GPYSLEQISQGIAGGQITDQTQVWSAGMSGWLPASQVPQLTGYFQATPPPPPPPAG
ncbi:MAG TPA: antifreeze protein, partial [Gimesia maris]|nr:antifreeze protein [Gimesia maris]